MSTALMYRIPPARFPPAVPDPSPPWAEQQEPFPMAQLPSLHQHKGFWLLPTPARSGACVPLLDGTRRRLSAQHSPCNPIWRAPQHPLHTQQVSEGSQRDVEKYGVIWEVLLRPPGEMCPPQEITEGERGLEAFKSLICVFSCCTPRYVTVVREVPGNLCASKPSSNLGRFVAAQSINSN